MNNTLNVLMNSIDKAAEMLSEAESARDSFLEPILKTLGTTGGGISRCSIDGDEVHIERSGSCRGCRWDDDYIFPLSIFTSEDPQSAAIEYVAAKKKAQEDEARRTKLATLQRLQKELGTSND